MSDSQREAHLLSIGKQCSHVSCLLVDFLPLKCQHCQKSFCQEHFKVEAHNCDSYDEMKYNRVAPNCTCRVCEICSEETHYNMQALYAIRLSLFALVRILTS